VWPEGVKTSEVKAEAGDSQEAHKFADQGFLLRHDNVRPQFAAATAEVIR
jgi:hypothetical protein